MTDLNRISDIVTEAGPDQQNLLAIFHRVQDEFGHVSEEALRVIADALNITAAEAYGVLTFYHDFRTAPKGRHTLRLCRAEACKSMGADRLAAEVAGALGIGFGETTPDGAVSLEEVFCLGLCALAPAGDLDGKQYARLTAPRVADLAGKVRA